MGAVRRRDLGSGVLLALCLVPLLRGAAAIRFVIDREECFSHNVDYEGDTVHVSFVVIKADTPWHYTQDGVDLVIKDPREHFGPLFEQIAKLDEALYNIQFEHHWLEAQTDRQAILNENMSRRAVHKALIESAGLVAASVVQVYLMRRLFERKLGSSRV
ncbi:transmembrane emp24 domain-containing protein p24beta2-like [Panicum miliaceum]|uniref:Transmembrane emp24 domain-containing protein p24beta2-like n=1 Tax=Panicum miliaceum TaxID=4540 RepID=A0A3L6T6P0_PANMI|nr:transmembrane emp24 domain-containing protein p24beta2-like [Panicum miliaceum]